MIALLTVIFVATINILPTGGAPLYDSAGYPELARRIPFFQDRLNSEVDFVRYAVRGDAARLLPLPEAVRLQQQMAAKDPYMPNREQAVANLLRVGWGIDRETLPPRVMGIDLSGPEVLESLRKSLVPGGKSAKPPNEDPSAVGAIHLVGLLGSDADIKLLRPFLDSGNCYVRLSAAYAVERLGGYDEARAVMEEMVLSPPKRECPTYQMSAITHMFDKEDCIDIEMAIGFLSMHENPESDKGVYADFMLYLGEKFGVWNGSAEEWGEWLNDNGACPPMEEDAGVAALKYSSTGRYPELSRELPFFRERIESPLEKVQAALLKDVMMVGRSARSKEKLAVFLRHMAAKGRGEFVRFHSWSSLFNGYPIEKDALPQRFLGVETRGAEALLHIRDKLETTETYRAGFTHQPMPVSESNDMLPYIRIIGVIGNNNDLKLLARYHESNNPTLRDEAARAAIRIENPDLDRGKLKKYLPMDSVPGKKHLAEAARFFLGSQPGCEQLRDQIDHLRKEEVSELPGAKRNVILMSLARNYGVWKDTAGEWAQWYRRESLCAGTEK